MGNDSFDEAVDYAQMLSSDDCKDEVGDHVFQAAQELTDETISREQRISNAEEYMRTSLTRSDHDEYRKELRERYVQDPLDLAMAVSRFDTLVHDLASALGE